jgi:hypothetical protein
MPPPSLGAEKSRTSAAAGACGDADVWVEAVVAGPPGSAHAGRTASAASDHTRNRRAVIEAIHSTPSLLTEVFRERADTPAGLARLRREVVAADEVPVRVIGHLTGDEDESAARRGNDVCVIRGAEVQPGHGLAVPR